MFSCSDVRTPLRQSAFIPACSDCTGSGSRSGAMVTVTARAVTVRRGSSPGGALTGSSDPDKSLVTGPFSGGHSD